MRRTSMLDTPLRILVTLAVVAAIFWGAIAFLAWGFESRHWSPPIVATICLSISSLSLAFYALLLVRKRRRNRNIHA